MKKVLGLFIPTIAACLMIVITFYLLTASSQVMAASNSLVPKGGILVNTLDDELNSDGDCSLREAITSANDNTAVDACLAGDAIITDTITFDVSGTITVTSQLDVLAGGPLVIDGANSITTSGGSSTRVWWVGEGSDLTLGYLSVIDGFDTIDKRGGGVYNQDGRVNIINCTFSENVAPDFGGAIFNAGTMKISGSTFTGNISFQGGAISNQGILSLHESNLIDNSGGYAGAIDNNGTFTMTNSTLSGNDSWSWFGGGIVNWISMTITNSTISGNIANTDGGGIDNRGDLTIINSTLSGNGANNGLGGGIRNWTGSTFLVNSMIVNSPSGGDCWINSGMIIDGGHNISTDASCGFDPANGSMPSTDPVLGPLQDNGGSTWTHALLPESPAIDAGDDAQCPPTDQRGVTRPQDGDGDGTTVCDIGSYELEPAQLVVTTLDDELNADGDCSLREAIEAANTNAIYDECGNGGLLPDTITFNVSGTITLFNLLNVVGGGPLIIEGANNITLSGNGSVQILVNSYGADLTLRSLKLVNGHSPYDGGGIFNNGELVVDSCNLTDNSAHSGGGGILNWNKLRISNSTLSGNSADWGGGISNSGDITITNSTFVGNEEWSDMGGGAIFNDNNLSIINSTFSSNYADIICGGINNYGGVMTIANSSFFGNTTNGFGGAVCNYGYALLTNTIVANSPNGGDCYGFINDGGHNISSDNTCNFDPANGSMPSTDPVLGPLQDNGGPTLTHALLPGSPAIDAGDEAQCPPIDQRGVLRPQDGNGDGTALCDIGSYELESPPVPPAIITISGASEAVAGPSVYFTATVEPVSTTLPIEYVWWASGHPPITETRGLTDTVGWAWEMPGTYAITVTASNQAGSVMDTHAITITTPLSSLYLPLVMNTNGWETGFIPSFSLPGGSEVIGLILIGAVSRWKRRG